MSYEKTYHLHLILKVQSNDPMEYVTPELVASGVRNLLAADTPGAVKTQVVDVSVWPGFRHELLLKLDQLNATLAELKKVAEGPDV